METKNHRNEDDAFVSMKRKISDIEDENLSQAKKKESANKKMGKGIVLLKNFLSAEEQLDLISTLPPEGFFVCNNERSVRVKNEHKESI